jgi:hypothetical protein
MPGLVRYGAPSAMASFIDSPDPIYGTGMDGSVTLDGTTTILSMAPSSSVYTMTRDIYCYNLTINASVTLKTAGYRLFVKNILTLNASSVIGFTTGFSTAGSIAQGGASNTAVTNSLGGASSTQTATAPIAGLGSSAYYDVPWQAIKGYAVSATTTTPTFLRGGAGGTSQEGGGVVIVSARYISPPSSGSATISANATSPAGGGVVIVISSSAALPAGVTTSVTGNASGTSKYLQLV